MPDETSRPNALISHIDVVHNACESVRDLSRLGYDFADILQQSNVDEEFLIKTFEIANLPLTNTRASKKRMIRQEISDSSKKFRSAPFGNDNWIKDLVIELSDDDFEPMKEENIGAVTLNNTRKEEEAWLKRELEEKEQKMEEMRKYIESLENKKYLESHIEEVPDKLIRETSIRPEMEFQISKVTLLQKRIQKTSKLLERYQSEAENDQLQVEKLEQELNLRMESLDTKLKLLTHITEIMAKQQKDLRELCKEQIGNVEFGDNVYKWIQDNLKTPLDSEDDDESGSNQLKFTVCENSWKAPSQEEEIDNSTHAHENIDETISTQLVSTGTREEEVTSNFIHATHFSVECQAKIFEPYNSPLMCFKSYRFSPIFDDRKISSLTWNNKIDAMKEFCTYELLNGVCNDPDCLLQHFRNTLVNETDIIIDLAKSVVGDSNQERQAYIKSLTALLSQDKNEAFESMVSIIKLFRKNHLPADAFLDWIRFGTI